MNAIRKLAIVTAALTATAACPAGADDLVAVTAKLGAAAATVKSFVVEMHVNGTTGVDGSLTFVRPLSIKSAFHMGQMLVETYMVDGIVYVHLPNAGWQKMKIDSLHPPQQSVNIADSLKTSKVTLLPDRQENGAAVGVVQVETQLPAIAGPMAQGGLQKIVCSYDKSSYRMKVCTNDIMTMTYTKYNDRTNAVMLPVEARNAAEMALPQPSPAMSPGPGPSASGEPATSTSPAISPLPALPPSPAPTTSPAT